MGSLESENSLWCISWQGDRPVDVGLWCMFLQCLTVYHCLIWPVHGPVDLPSGHDRRSSESHRKPSSKFLIQLPLPRIGWKWARQQAGRRRWKAWQAHTCRRRNPRPVSGGRRSRVHSAAGIEVLSTKSSQIKVALTNRFNLVILLDCVDTCHYVSLKLHITQAISLPMDRQCHIGHTKRLLVETFSNFTF